MNKKLILLLFSSILLIALTKPVQAKSCYDTEKPPIPASLKFRDVILEEHQIKIKIPENYRF